MNGFIHLDPDELTGGLVVNVKDIKAVYYRPFEERTIIFINGVSSGNEFYVLGKKTKEIYDAICKAQDGEQE